MAKDYSRVSVRPDRVVCNQCGTEMYVRYIPLSLLPCRGMLDGRGTGGGTLRQLRLWQRIAKTAGFGGVWDTTATSVPTRTATISVRAEVATTAAAAPRKINF